MIALVLKDSFNLDLSVKPAVELETLPFRLKALESFVRLMFVFAAPQTSSEKHWKSRF